MPTFPDMLPTGYVDAQRKRFMARLSPFFSSDRMEFIEQAYFLSKNAHRPQMRDDGTRYFEHPKTVAWLLAIYFQVHDWRTIVIALLHDMLEDSFIMTPRFIGRTFDNKVKFGVKLLSKNDFDKAEVGDVDAAYYDRFVTDGDWRVLMVKLVDRIHNIMTMDGMEPDRVARKLDETRMYFPALERALMQRVPEAYREQARDVIATLNLSIIEREQWLAAQAG